MPGDFKVPVKWTIERTEDHYLEINAFLNAKYKKPGHYAKPGGWITSTTQPKVETAYKAKPAGYKEITFEQFMQYIVGEGAKENVEENLKGLPKYWAVEKTNSPAFPEVINYINNVSDLQFAGNGMGFYGFDGNFKRVNGPDAFTQNVIVLTAEQFVAALKGENGIPAVRERKVKPAIGANQILVDFKCISVFPFGKFKVGDLASSKGKEVVLSDEDYTDYPQHWEPVYQEKFKVGDYAACKVVINGSILIVGAIRKVKAVGDNAAGQFISIDESPAAVNIQRYSKNFRFATAAEIQIAEEVLVGGYRVVREGNNLIVGNIRITKEDINAYKKLSGQGAANVRYGNHVLDMPLLNRLEAKLVD